MTLVVCHVIEKSLYKNLQFVVFTVCCSGENTLIFCLISCTMFCLVSPHVLFVVLFISYCLPAAVTPYHLTLTLSWDHIDFLPDVITIKTLMWGDYNSLSVLVPAWEDVTRFCFHSVACLFLKHFPENWSVFTHRKNMDMIMTEWLLCHADEGNRLEIGRLMRFSQSVRLVVWTQIKLTHSD